MELSGSACIRFGWETFKKRPWMLIGVFLLTTALSSVLNSAISQIFGQQGTGAFAAFFANLVVQTFVGIAFTSFALKAHDSIESAGLADLWRPHFFLNYLCMSVLFFLAAVAGLILIIIPGVIVILMFYFSGYIVVDRNLGPIAAMKESARITRGHRWELLGLLGLIILLNILGLLALIVGLLVTIPVTMLSIAHAYRTLSGQASPATA